MIKVSMVSLGCPKNTVDSEFMLGQVEQHQMQISTDPNQADIVIVNTCGFIESAKQESIDTILKLNLLKEKGQLKGIVVAGCLVNKYHKQLKEELIEADAFIGTNNLTQIVPAIYLILNPDGSPKDHYFSRQPQALYDHLTPRRQITPSHYAYLKISEGCDNTCKFCTIPMMRGKNKSRLLDSLVKEAEQLAAQGVRELNVIGQDTTDYGTDLYGESKLPELLRRLSQIKDLQWIRLLYAFPFHVTDQLIQVLKEEEKICRYLDMPIQHFDDELLLEMNRKLDGKGTLKLIDKLRKEIPDLALRTTLIVGLPGETESKFKLMQKRIEEIQFERLGVFTYSDEEHASAFKLPNKVTEEIKIERQKSLMLLQQEISKEKNKEAIGKTIKVLVDNLDDKKNNLWCARSQWDAPEIDGLVYLKSENVKPGDLLNVKIMASSEYDLTAQPI